MPNAASSTDLAGGAYRSRATVAMGFVSGMISGMRRLGRDLVPLLAASNIDLADAASRIPVDRYAALYNRVVAELDDEAFGLFSRSMPPGSFEFLCRSMLGAATLAEAMARAARFLRIVLPDLAVSIRRDASLAELRITEVRPLTAERDDPARVFAFEWLLRLLHGVACWFVGRGLALDAVRFPYARPLHADDYALVYTEHSRFESNAPATDNRGALVASFQANLLDLPIRRDDAALTAFLDGAPGKISMLYRRDREMVFRVRDLLRDALPANLSVAEVASRLHVSPRTLHRRLDEEGAGFRTIKDAIRRDIALARLTKTRQPIARIAADLGYADTSAFYRAFVVWCGVSPEHFRRRLAERGSQLSSG
ncbi:MAG: AraC family transcriptional regulator [Thauera sp.]|nr:AraC family transcriptional regulator [Thauera sp.]